MGRTTSAFTGAVVMAAALISGARTDVPSAVSRPSTNSAPAISALI
jgi:hypothetical protein